MSLPARKKLKTNEGEAIQSDPDYESIGGNPKRKSVAKPLNILDLNSDCLLHIFDLKNVSVLELALISQTCTKLRTIATDIFVRSHKICDFATMKLDNASMVDRVLIAFGATISNLCIDFTQYSIDGVTIIDSMLRNCAELQSLTMKSFEIPDCPIVFAKMRRLFEKLKSLNIHIVVVDGYHEWDQENCTVTSKGNVMNFFDDCNSLVRLSVSYCYALHEVIFGSKFPKLEHFHYHDTGDFVGGLRGFAFRHQNLKTLLLWTSIKIPSALERFAANCTKLQELEFFAGEFPEDCDSALRQLGRLQYLAKLKIYCCKQSAIKLFSALQESTSLRELHLDGVEGFCNLLPAFAQIKSLRILKLCCAENLQNINDLRNLAHLNELFIESTTVRQFDFDLVDIVRCLVNLKKFKFYVSVHEKDYYCISRNVYYQLVNVVQHRSVGGNAYLEVDCPTTSDFQDLLCRTVEFKGL